MPQSQPDGYLATPPSGEGRSVLLLHAWWGLNDTMKAFCDRLAQAGFIAFAPDLYHGRVARDVPAAEALSGALDAGRARAEIAGAAASLPQGAASPGRGIAVVGFSLGAFYALDLSVTHPDRVHSVVIYYGTRPGDYAHARAAYLGHFAESDDFEPRSDVDALEAALLAADRAVTFHHYPGADHWFAEPDRPHAFNRPAAALAWDRTLAFLRRPPRPF